LTSRVSVVIPTKDAEETIEACISSILENGGSHEIIIVDDSSDRTPQIASKYPVAIIRAPGKNISEKSNLGIELASCDIIAFIDQDCAVPRDWIPRALKLIEETGAHALGGPSLTFPEADFRERCSGLVLGSWFGAGPSADRYRIGRPEPFEADESKLTSCNLFFDGKALREAGGFDPKLGSCEENELLFRMRAKGFRVFCAPSLYVWHRRRPIFRPFLREMFWYANGRGNFLRMNPRSLRVAHLIPSAFALGLILGSASSLLGLLVEPFAFALGLYFALDAIVSTRAAIGGRVGLKAIPALMAAFFLSHMAYGIGLIYGLFGGIYRYRRQRDRGIRRPSGPLTDLPV
jgi:GT2 family glycosyltransferase